MSIIPVAPLIVPPSVWKKGDTCPSCRYFTVDRVGDKVCRRLPPSPTIFILPPRPPQMEPHYESVAAFPVVEDDYWCGMYERKLG